MSQGDRPGWGARLAMALFSGLFMVAFGAGGVFVGVVPLIDTAIQAVQVQGWQPVSAQVLSVKLDSRRGSKGSVSYTVSARYAYRYEGRDHEATRIGLDRWAGSDNIGSWHHDWYDRLEDARTREQPVAAWVNPQQPDQAVLERSVRMGLLAFRLPFAILFTGVGLGAAVVFVMALAGRLAPPRKLSSARQRHEASAADFNSRQAEGSLRPWQPGKATPALPAGVRGSLLQGDAQLRFVRWWPRVLGLVMLLALPLWLLAGPSAGPGSDAGMSRVLRLLPVALAATAWLAVALHLLSLRWHWQLDQGQLLIERGSWLRLRRQRLAAQDLRTLSHKLVYTSKTGNGPTVEHRCLLGRSGGGTPVVLSPALASPDDLQAVSLHLQQALQQVRRPDPPFSGGAAPAAAGPASAGRGRSKRRS